MSDQPAPRASLVSIVAIFALFGLFLASIYYVYSPRRTGVFAGDGIHTDAQRIENLAKLREKEHKQAASYGWADQKAGVIQLPLERAQELTLQRYAKQP
jgi:hypothetical protein